MTTRAEFDARRTRGRILKMQEQAMDSIALIHSLSRERNPERKRDLMLAIIDKQREIANEAETLESERFEAWQQRNSNDKQQ